MSPSVQSLSITSRRQMLVATLSAVAGSSLHAKAPLKASESPLREVLYRGLGDDMQVARLWLLLAEQAQRAAVLSRCKLGQRPLAELEWEPDFQAALMQDCRQIHTLPVFQRVFVQTWLEATDQVWRELSSQERQRWSNWLAAPEASSALQSMRAERLLSHWSEPDWNVDARTGTPTAIPIILVVQGLRQAGVLPTVIQAVTQAQPELGSQLMKINAQYLRNPRTSRTLLDTSKKLPQYAQAIGDHYMALADKRWPARVSWGDGPLANHPLQCDFVLQAEIARIAGDDARKLRPADYAPAALAKYCS
ncbi:hypothetical protein [Comamonas sp. 4034]|uniref:hypothetical protein n=1 Tax=Comamonas sp. 4034 TaxID=3156455 RepID=UPI003D2610B7